MTTKIHATYDALGNPTAFHLTGGQVHDVQGADVLLPELAERIGMLFADDASIRVLDVLKANGVEAVIPPKPNRTEKRDYDREKYKWRHLIENLFQKLKQFKGIATLIRQICRELMGGIYFVASLIWLK